MVFLHECSYMQPFTGVNSLSSLWINYWDAIFHLQGKPFLCKAIIFWSLATSSSLTKMNVDMQRIAKWQLSRMDNAAIAC